jgi:hypothetical protein
VGGAPYKHHEQTEYDSHSGCTRAKQKTRNIAHNAVLPSKTRLEPRGFVAPTITEKPVYDIVNCGPRHRFVVKGKNGPFIVHNCVQAIARDIIADNMFSFYKETGLYPALMVHDELVYVVPENQAEKLLDKLQQIMRTPPQWWPDIVLESEGDIADTYGDAK